MAKKVDLTTKASMWDYLLDLFGDFSKRPEVTSCYDFGKKYINGIKGWQFPINTVKQANKRGQLLTMDLDFPGNKCQLNCNYCFAKAGEKTSTYYRPDQGDTPLTITQIKQHVLEAKKMGLQSIKIIGYREPFENPNIFDFIEFATEQNIWVVIFTAGYTLGEKFFDNDVKKTIDFFATHNTSLMVKFHTLDEAEEEKIVGKSGYPQKRNRYLRMLLDDKRFTNQTPTRLGIENVLSSSRKINNRDSDLKQYWDMTRRVDELQMIYKFLKINRNVFVDINPPIPVGRTGTVAEARSAGLLSEGNLIHLCRSIYAINKEYGIPFMGVSPYFGGNPCTQLPNGLYLTLSGKVLTCCGGDEVIGNVNDDSLKEIFAMNPHRSSNTLFHDCPYRKNAGIMSEKIIREVEEGLD